MAQYGFGTSGQILTSNGSGNMPSWQAPLGGSSAFKVVLGSNSYNVTGDDTNYPILYDTTVYDLGSEVTLNSSGETIFTANETGYYWFNLSMVVNNLGASAGYSTWTIHMRPSGDAEYLAKVANPYNIRDNDNQAGYSYSSLIQLDASQHISISFQVYGGTKNVGLTGGNYNFWSGFRVA